MFRELNEKEIQYLIRLVDFDGTIPPGERENLIRRLQGQEEDRKLKNTSCTLWNDQIEIADSTENKSQFIRNCIDYYLGRRDTVL